jgi:hypothetical protein
MNLINGKIFFVWALTLLSTRPSCDGQSSSFDSTDKELAALYAKIFPFYNSDQDSLDYYSDLFSSRFTHFIEDHPATLRYKFPSLSTSNACRIVTTKDGLFRIYSWNTWQGGSMYSFKNRYQFQSAQKVNSGALNGGEGDMGTYYTDVFSLKIKDNTYILAISGGNESTKDAYETIGAFAVSGDTLNDQTKLIKTKSGLSNSISIEYDFFSVIYRRERPMRLIKYDDDKKAISIPIVLENGKVTDRRLLYQFNGKYFERVLTQPMAAKNK